MFQDALGQHGPVARGLVVLDPVGSPELRPPQNLCDVRIPTDLVTILLPRGKVAAHKAECGLMDAHTH